MKNILIMLAVALAPQAALAASVDIIPNSELAFVVTDIISTGDHPDVQGEVTIGELMSVRIPNGAPAEDSETTYSLYTAHYQLRGDLPGAGTYLLSMTSPDQNEYVIDSPCHVEITVQ